MAKKKKPAIVEPPIGRLCLVTPAGADPSVFAGALEAAFQGGDVATLFIVDEGASPAALQKLAEVAVPIAQAHGAAAIVPNDTRLFGRVHADGLHVDTGIADLKAALDTLRPDGMVGAGGLTTRHDAMLAGEADCDYLFFGRFDGDTGDAIFDKAFDLAAWWSAVFEIPAVVMGGRAIASVAEAVDARIEFVALRSAVWEHPEGPAAAVAEANRLIAAHQAEALP
ncbi:thiamine phosphate synthase [Kaistia dalseonensis]|uniref:Thiamine-phosphate pyrophosphorylase n=1 Tax=Kaistia dalseonensis TaxID=410840 RepID=A0ABU0HA36_9HYPH|nr:thiamine phosphate synthase [Kaistia dalseonensis]MCX5496553.1 thiamine phosphate synthase [Kaistia dalseonensis]MDQ0439175.1 thiamine-phosphate pyrophosphorylase [Kaistia dalseonensis]